MAAKHDRGVIVLALTSNPEGASVQRAGRRRRPYGGPAHRRRRRRRQRRRSAIGHVGLVVGATVGELGVDLSGLGGPILIPGLGARAAPLPIWAGFSAPSRP